MAKMLGKSGTFACGCCYNDTKARAKRATKRRERAAWKKEIR